MGNDEPVIPFFPNSDYSYVFLVAIIFVYHNNVNSCSRTGVSGVVGVLSALLRRADQGGSYVVSVYLSVMTA